MRCSAPHSPHRQQLYSNHLQNLKYLFCLCRYRYHSYPSMVYVYSIQLSPVQYWIAVVKERRLALGLLSLEVLQIVYCGLLLDTLYHSCILLLAWIHHLPPVPPYFSILLFSPLDPLDCVINILNSFHLGVKFFVLFNLYKKIPYTTLCAVLFCLTQYLIHVVSFFSLHDRLHVLRSAS